MSLISELLGGAGTAYLTQEGIEQARKLPTQLEQAATDIATRVGQAAEFRPYTVTTGGATTQFDPTGMSQTLSPQQQQLVSGLQGSALSGLGGLGSGVQGLGNLGSQAFSGASTALGQNTGAFASGLGGMYGAMGEQQLEQATRDRLGGLTGAIQERALGMMGQDVPTAESVYSQIRAIQSPEEERQRLALENRLAAQGRLGVTTSAFGGTPEQLALEKAQAEARNQASLQALQAADQLASSQQARQAQLAQLGGQLAQTGAGIEAQQQQLGQGLLGLGLQAQQLGGQLTNQDVARAAQLASLGQQATMLTPALEQANLANVVTALQASGIPQQQITAALQPALTGLGMAQRPADLEAQAIANLGQQQLQGIPSAINAEALLRQAQLEGITNLLMPQMTPQGNMVDTAVSGMLGGVGDAIGGLLGDVGNWVGGLFGGSSSDGSYVDSMGFRRNADGQIIGG